MLLYNEDDEELETEDKDEEDEEDEEGYDPDYGTDGVLTDPNGVN